MSTRTKLWLVLVSAVLLAVATHAEPVTQLKATDYVNDFAHVLNQNTIVQMDDICRQIDEKAHAKIAVVTVRSLDGSDIESYAVALFQQWGLGTKSTNRGVLILYAIDDHRDRIEVGYGLEPILPDGKTVDLRERLCHSCEVATIVRRCFLSRLGWQELLPTIPAFSSRTRKPKDQSNRQNRNHLADYRSVGSCSSAL